MEIKILFEPEYCYECGKIMDEEMYNDIIDFIGDAEIEDYKESYEDGPERLFGIILTIREEEFGFYILSNVAKETKRDCKMFTHSEPYDVEIELSRNKY